MTFMSLVPVEILLGGGEACASVVHNYNYKFPHPPFVWPCFTEWCFSFFLEGGGALTPSSGELELFYGSGSLTDSCGLNLEWKIGWCQLSEFLTLDFSFRTLTSYSMSNHMPYVDNISQIFAFKFAFQDSTQKNCIKYCKQLDYYFIL